MKFQYVLIKKDKIKFKDSQLQGYKNLINEKDELLREKFIENMRLEAEIFSIKKQLNDYIEYYRDEKQNKHLIIEQLDLAKSEIETLRIALHKCRYELGKAKEVNKNNNDLLERYETDKYIAMKNLVNKASTGRLKKKREKELYLEILKNKK